MNRKDLSKEEQKEYDMIQEINPKWTPNQIFSQMKDNELGQGFEETRLGYDERTNEQKLDDEDKYGEKGDFVGEEGFLEGIFGDLFNDVESSSDTEEDRLRREIRSLNRERSHVFDDEMGYMAASDPLSYHGREQTQNLDNIREIEQLVEALQRGEADRLAGTEQTFDNRDLSLVQGNIQGALPEGLQGGLQAQPPVDPTSVSPYGISQQQLMQALQKSQMPQDQPGMNMPALAQEEQLRLQMQMANSAMPQTLQAGGGQGPGTSYNRPRMYNPWRGNPQSRFQ
jgi:hypothetical protein